MSVSQSEALALGIGDPNTLTRRELIEFFEIVHPIESKHGFKHKDVRVLRKEAEKYLSKTKPLDYLRNAKRMSQNQKDVDQRFVDFIRKQTKEYDDALAKTQQELQHFANELAGEKPDKPSYLKASTLIPLGLTTLAGAVALKKYGQFRKEDQAKKQEEKMEEQQSAQFLDENAPKFPVESNVSEMDIEHVKNLYSYLITEIPSVPLTEVLQLFTKDHPSYADYTLLMDQILDLLEKMKEEQIPSIEMTINNIFPNPTETKNFLLTRLNISKQKAKPLLA